jgi:hypothetical protein
MERFSVSKVTARGSVGVVARSDRFEVWARRARGGPKGRRYYVVCFSVVEVLSKDPRRVREVELPSTISSNLDKIVEWVSRKS